MVATVPGGPKTSRTTCLGLNGTMSLAAPLGVEVTSLEAKMPFRRYTANPATATTSTATRSIHRRINRLPIENRGIRDPFDERSTGADVGHLLDGRLDQLGRPYDTGPARAHQTCLLTADFQAYLSNEICCC